MMLPKDKPLYANLGTSFTDFGQLLAELNGAGTTGYITVNFPDYEGVVLLASGDVVNALEQSPGSRVSGSAAQATVSARVKSRGGTISVFALAPELVGLLSVLLESDLVFKGLDTSFANPDRLVAKLRDDGHTGHLEFVLPEGRGDGIIFMRSGQVIEAVFTQGAETRSGEAVAETIIQAAASYGATFDVFQAIAARPSSAALSEPAREPVAVYAPAFTSGGAREEAAGEAAGALPANVTPIQAQGAKVDPEELMSFWSEMLSRAEGAVDKLSSEGKFADAFREVTVEKASTYPFLDPFAGEFEYRAGKAAFHGAIPHDLSEALAECLQDTISRLAFRTKRADLESRVRAELSEMNWSHASMIEGFSPTMQALVS